jgi:hypothetical protein
VTSRIREILRWQDNSFAAPGGPTSGSSDGRPVTSADPGHLASVGNIE